MSSKHNKIRKMTSMAILIGLIILLSFTPLGYIRIGVLEMTILVIPVAVGAILLGPVAGLILGLTFGLSSFFQCFGFSAFGTTLMGINPLLTFIVCVIPRTFMGYLAGLIHYGLNKTKCNKSVTHIISNVSAALLNTILFMSLLCICFYHTEYIQTMVRDLNVSNVLHFIVLFVGINGLVEALISIFVGSAITLSLNKALSINKE